MGNLVKAINIGSGWIVDEKTGIEKPSTLHVGAWTKLIKKHFGSRLRFNDLTLLPEVDNQRINPEELETIYVALAELGWRIDKGPAKDAFLHVAKQRRFNPVKEYLIGLENDPNVEPLKIDSLACRYLQVESELSNAMLASCLVGAVARALDNGCQMDYLTCLKGNQGIHKSGFWRTLAGPFFSDTKQDNPKDMRLAIGSCWIYEWPELETMVSRKDQGIIKALITQRVDDFRPPYGSVISKHPRKSILVGTCNKDDFLRDETGSRRYWIIECPQKKGEKINLGLVLEERDRIWKTALLAYRSGRKPMLSYELEQKSILQNENYEGEHPFDPAIQSALAKWGDYPFTIQQILIESGLRELNKIDKSDIREAAIVLTKYGYVRDKNQTRIDGKRLRLWRIK